MATKRVKKLDPEAEIAIYQGAKDAIMERGWVQGDAMDSVTGRVCTLGALYLGAGAKASNRFPGFAEPYHHFKNNCRATTKVETKVAPRVAALLGFERDGWEADHIASWNDIDCRSEAEVLDLLDKAILDVKEEARGV